MDSVHGFSQIKCISHVPQEADNGKSLIKLYRSVKKISIFSYSLIDFNEPKVRFTTLIREQ